MTATTFNILHKMYPLFFIPIARHKTLPVPSDVAYQWFPKMRIFDWTNTQCVPHKHRRACGLENVAFPFDYLRHVPPVMSSILDLVVVVEVVLDDVVVAVVVMHWVVAVLWQHRFEIPVPREAPKEEEVFLHERPQVDEAEDVDPVFAMGFVRDYC